MPFEIDPTIVDFSRILRSFSDPGSPRKNTKYKYQDHILPLGSMYSSFLYLCVDLLWPLDTYPMENAYNPMMQIILENLCLS